MSPTIVNKNLILLEREGLVQSLPNGWLGKNRISDEYFSLVRGIQLPRSINKENLLPNEFLRYFWDVRNSTLNVKNDASFIICRLALRNDPRAWIWLKRTYSERLIQKYLKNLGTGEFYF